MERPAESDPQALTPAEWGSVLSALEVVIDMDRAQREVTLHELFDGDQRLLIRTRAVLDAEANAGPFSMTGTLPGARVGPYILHALIGRGGMGAIYRASRWTGPSSGRWRSS